MTEEELEKEAEEWLRGKGDNYGHFPIDCVRAYLASAEPREKRIEIDAEQIRALQKQNGELTDKVKELEEKLANADYQLEGRDNEIREHEAQIEQMKCCGNCKFYNKKYFRCEKTLLTLKSGLCHNFDKWEIKEK